MRSLLVFVGLLTLSCFALSELPQDRFGRNGNENLKANFKLPWPKALLFGAKLNLAMANIDLSSGKIGLTMAKVDLSEDAVEMPKANADLSGCNKILPTAEQESPGNKIDLNVLQPSVFTYCLTVNLTVNGQQEEVNDLLSNKFKFAIEASDGGNRLILHNYKEEFGKSFSWVNKPTECCVSWLKSKKEFHLYLEGKHVLGGTGNIEWGLSDKIEDSVLAGGQTRETVSGPISELKQWSRELNKDEVLQVADGSLKGDSVKEKPANWKITADNITEPFLPVRRCPYPMTSEIDQRNFTAKQRWQMRGFMPFPTPHTKKFEELSFCEWVYLEINSSSFYRILEYFDNGPSRHLTIDIRSNETFCIWGKENEQITAPGIEPGTWHHVCFTWSDIRNGTVDLYVDGELSLHRQVKKEGSHIGREINFYNIQYKPANPENPVEGFEMKATGIDMWDYALTPHEVLQSYECPAEKPGNVVAWATSGKAFKST